MPDCAAQKINKYIFKKSIPVSWAAAAGDEGRTVSVCCDQEAEETRVMRELNMQLLLSTVCVCVFVCQNRDPEEEAKTGGAV